MPKEHIPISSPTVSVEKPLTQAEPGSIALHPDDPFPLGDGLPCPRPSKYQDLDTLSRLTPLLKAELQERI